MARVRDETRMKRCAGVGDGCAGVRINGKCERKIRSQFHPLRPFVRTLRSTSVEIKRRFCTSALDVADDEVDDAGDARIREGRHWPISEELITPLLREILAAARPVVSSIIDSAVRNLQS